MLVTVLVRMCEQGLLAVGFFDFGLGAGGADRLEGQDLVEVGGLAAADAQDGSLLLGSVLALLVALVMVAAAGGVVGGICPRGGCAGRHVAPGPVLDRVGTGGRLAEGGLL